MVGFDDKRSEELVVFMKDLPKNSNFFADVAMKRPKLPDRPTAFANLTGKIISEVLAPTQKIIPFPSFLGAIGRMYRLPIDRKFFKGNSMSFKLVIEKGDASVGVSYVNEINFLVKSNPIKIKEVFLESKVVMV